MNKLIMLFVFSVFTTSVFATTTSAPTAAQTAQWKKTKTCNVGAKGMKGATRNNYMKKCLAKP